MNQRLARSLRPYLRQTQPEAPPARSAMPGPLVLDLIAALVESGAPPATALKDAGTVLTDLGDPRGPRLLRLADLITAPSSAAEKDPITASLSEALTLAARSGLPPSALIRRAAVEERRRQAAARAAAVHRLEVLLVIPGAVCLLPAFVLLGIVPLVIRLLTG